MTKNEIYRELSNTGGDVAFIANVVFCHATNPSKKLKGLRKLLQDGKDVRSGNEIDTIRIDGETRSLSFLDSVRS